MGLQVFTAYLIDLLVGDPRFLPHPVVLIGKCISLLESLVRKLVVSPRGLQLAGAGVVVIIVGGSYTVTVILLKFLSLVHPALGYMAGIWLISTTIAARGLSGVAGELRELLQQGKMDMARQQVGMVVGRDSHNMEAEDIARATVETVAENTTDAVVAPLFYAFIAGPPGAMAYRAVNTLDSMLGYKDEKFRHLGWAAAKFDDLVNYIPARITGILMLCAAWLTGRNAKGGFRVLQSDAHRHPSPNAGIPEAVTAGALNIRLGGLNYYHGRPSQRAYMGSGSKVQPVHIRATVDLMHLTSFLAALLGMVISLLLSR
jgi:adenosylcobinamide-phosphate synthase